MDRYRLALIGHGDPVIRQAIKIEAGSQEFLERHPVDAFAVYQHIQRRVVTVLPSTAAVIFFGVIVLVNHLPVDGIRIFLIPISLTQFERTKDLSLAFYVDVFDEERCSGNSGLVYTASRSKYTNFAP